MSDGKSYEDAQRERMQAAEKERAEKEAAMTPEEREQARRESDARRSNRAQGTGRENTAIPEYTREPPPPSQEAPFAANPKPPLKILNIDGGGNGDAASWMDFSEPAPMELLQAIYDNSKDGPVTIWSRHLAEANFSAQLWNWLLEGDNAWRSRTLSMQLWEPPTEVPPRDAEAINFTPPARPKQEQRQTTRAQSAEQRPAQPAQQARSK